MNFAKFANRPQSQLEETKFENAGPLFILAFQRKFKTYVEGLDPSASGSVVASSLYVEACIVIIVSTTLIENVEIVWAA